MTDDTIFHGLLPEFVYRDDKAPFNRLNKHARHVIRLAFRQALSLGSTDIAPEHLFMAILRISDAFTVYTLERVGTSPYNVRLAADDELVDPHPHRIELQRAETESDS